MAMVEGNTKFTVRESKSEVKWSEVNEYDRLIKF
jgi:hypothetical protein